VEFLLVSIPVLLLTLGGIELAHWFHVRQMVDLALMQAARAGATQHAQPAAIAQAFEQALHPLFAAPTPEATAARLKIALRQRSQAMHGNPPWQIRILRPDARDYARFATPALVVARKSGLAAIRNDYQHEQQQGRAPGDPDATIFAANTLVLRLIYPHPPLLPGIAHLIANLNVHIDAYAQRALAAGLLPIVREIRLDMASHPVDWPSLPDGRVIKKEAADGISAGTPSPANAACSGLWCQSQQRHHRCCPHHQIWPTAKTKQQATCPDRNPTTGKISCPKTTIVFSDAADLRSPPNFVSQTLFLMLPMAAVQLACAHTAGDAAHTPGPLVWHRTQTNHSAVSRG